MISSLPTKNFVTLPNGKCPVFSQKVDEISKSEVHQTFSNFSSLIDEYLGIAFKAYYFVLIAMQKKIQCKSI